MIDGKANGAIFAMLVVGAALTPLFLLSAGAIGLVAFTLATGFAIKNVFDWAKNVEKAQNDFQFQQATAWAAVNAVADIAFATLAFKAAGYLPEIAGINFVDTMEKFAAAWKFMLEKTFGN